MPTGRLWLSMVVVAMAMTEVITVAMEWLLLGRVTVDYLLTGMVASVLVASLVVALILYSSAQTRQLAANLAVSEEHYRCLAEDMPTFIATFLPGGTLTYANEALTTLVGMTRNELKGRNFFDFLSADDQKMVRERLALLTPEQPIETHEQKYPRPGVGDAYQQWTNRAFFDATGRVIRFQAIGKDITERRQAEDELRIAAVAFASQNGMMITDPSGVILRVNPAFTRLTGYSAAEAIGQTPALLSSGRHGPLFYQRLWDSLKEKGYWQGEVWNKRKNGQIYAEMLSITAIITPDHRLTHYVGSFTDITENKEAEAEIHRLAYYDALTRLPNRRLLQDRITQAIVAVARSRRYGAIFLIDLDHFKTLNDTRGHDVGDLLLVKIAQRLRATVREGDTVARQGGDEFVVLLEDLGTEIDEAAALAQQLGDKLLEAIDRPFDLNGLEYHCKLSIGVALFDEQKTFEDLLKQADLALYQAKNSGRNALRFFDPAMQAAMDLRGTLEAELRRALELDQLRLYYQPQISSERRVIGVESLLRWQHPERGLVPPDDFIPLAEDTGLILPIGLWVLTSACAQLKTWEGNASTRELQVAVNVSARQFRQADFVDQVQGVLEASGANPARLKLELTESLVLEDVKGAIAKMKAIKRLGVSFAMDDFGTGYSSLSYLAQLPLDQLKIDRSFVRKLQANSSEEVIVRTIITMGRGLGLHVIAEGVETDAQHKLLELHGCHAYQGYLFSRPLPLQETEEFLQRF